MTATPRVLIVGAGSAGARHARELLRLGTDVSVMDQQQERAEAITGATVVRSGAFPSGFDAIVIATPTSLHAEHVLAALATGAKVLVEKPLSVSGDRLAEILDGAEDHLAVAFNLRFHEPVQEVVRRVHGGDVGRVLSVRVWYGQDLSTWRPGQDYRASYSSRSQLGGGILNDASHELDLLRWLLGGTFDVVGATVDRLSTLEIDVEDTVHALLRHETGAVANVWLDMVSARYRRGIEVVGSKGTLRFDWARQRIEYEDAERFETLVRETPISESYVRQAAAVVGWVQGQARMPVGATDGAAVVRLADEIRRAAL